DLLAERPLARGAAIVARVLIGAAEAAPYVRLKPGPRYHLPTAARLSRRRTCQSFCNCQRQKRLSCRSMSTTSSRLRQAMTASEVWSVTDASELYEVERWGKGYFSINASGHVQVHPTKDPARAIDLKQLVDDLQARAITLPLLIRFSDLLNHRLADIHDAFQAAIAQHQYNGRYCCVYPIKVNQQRQVVEEVLNFGAPYQFGLEAGSKPELLAVIALASNDTPIMC